jgi:chromosome segregation ATPase
VAADLRKFSELFTELENQVVSLSKREAELQQSARTLEAREGFLNGSITELQAKLQQAREQIAEAEAEKQRMLDTLQAEYDRLKVEVTALDSKRQRMQSTLDTMQQAADQAAGEHQTVLQAKRDEIQAADAELASRQTDIAEADKLIANKQAAISHIEAAEADKQAELDSFTAECEKQATDERIKLQAIRKDIIMAQDEYADIYDKLQGKQAEYDASDKKHAEYLEYEQRANKALEAREQSLLQKEAELDQKLLRVNRRGAVLDNL